VPLVEEGWTEGQVPALAVRRYVAPLIEAGAGVVVLGCTHYPLLGPLIAEAAAELAGRPVPVVDSAHATAEVVAEWLAQGRIPRSTRTARPNLELLVTDLPEGFANVARRFLGGHEVPEVHQVDIDVR
jgi:glutamate racemase